MRQKAWVFLQEIWPMLYFVKFRQLKYFAQDVFLYQHGSVFWMCFSLFFLAVLTLDLNWQVQPPIYCYFLVCPAELVAVKYSIYIWIVSSYSKVYIVRPGCYRLLEGVLRKSKLGHGRLYRWTENSFPFFLYLKPVEISKKCFNIIWTSLKVV